MKAMGSDGVFGHTLREGRQHLMSPIYNGMECYLKRGKGSEGMEES